MAEVIHDATPENIAVVVVCIEAGYRAIRGTDSTMEDVEMALTEQTWDLAGHRLHIGMRLRVHHRRPPLPILVEDGQPQGFECMTADSYRG